MAKIYFVRHQAAGIVHEFPFAAEPSEAQRAAVAKLCLQRFGATHPKSKEEYWTRIVEVDLLGSDDVPVIPEQGGETANVAGVGAIGVSGTGTVTPKAQSASETISTRDGGQLTIAANDIATLTVKGG